MKKKTRIILNVILGLILLSCIISLVFWSIHCYKLHYDIFISEYNAQMDKIGYYNEDIHMLDQNTEWVRYQVNLIGNVCCWVVVLFYVLFKLFALIYDQYRAFIYWEK